jgi:hypothetical protein
MKGRIATLLLVTAGTVALSSTVLAQAGGDSGGTGGTAGAASSAHEPAWPLTADRWNEMRPDVQRRWSRLTDHDLSTAPTRDHLVDAIQSRYGVPRAEAERQVESWTMQARQGSR